MNFGTLLCSGDWKFIVERDVYGETRVFGGLNNYDFELVLQPGEHFETPRFLAGFTRGGFGEMTRTIHRWSATQLCSEYWAHRPRPVVFNTFSCIRRTELTEQGVLDLIHKAAEVGCELFIIDDGWQHALGDWYPDPVKFPNGLRPVIEEVAKLGMTFGLWIEPEAFEIKSNLYKEHPEWAMAYPGCEPDVRYRGDADRHSIMLNLANPEVADYLYTSIHKLVAETGISYLKLDMNCYFTAPGGAERVWIDYARNLDWIFQSISREFPHLLLENCASSESLAVWMRKWLQHVNTPFSDTMLENGFNGMHTLLPQ